MTPWEGNFGSFVERMRAEIHRNMPEKGTSWRNMSNAELLQLMKRYINQENWVAVANIAFMVCTMKKKYYCPVCKEEYESEDALKPCPKGHTHYEMIAVADAEMKGDQKVSGWNVCIEIDQKLLDFFAWYLQRQGITFGEYLTQAILCDITSNICSCGCGKIGSIEGDEEFKIPTKFQPFIQMINEGKYDEIGKLVKK